MAEGKIAVSECDLCGDQHDPSTHGDPETVIQPSLHTLEEYAELCIEEAEARGLPGDDLRGDLESEDAETSEIIEDALDRMRDAGFVVYEGDDTLLIYAR
jgi:hypothetical protein